eukprot:3715380-Prymnesium_polylepis.1
MGQRPFGVYSKALHHSYSWGMHWHTHPTTSLALRHAQTPSDEEGCVGQAPSVRPQATADPPERHVLRPSTG